MCSRSPGQRKDRWALREQVRLRFRVPERPDAEECVHLHQSPLVVQRPRCVRCGIRPADSITAVLTFGRTEPDEHALDSRATARARASTDATHRCFGAERASYVDLDDLRADFLNATFAPPEVVGEVVDEKGVVETDPQSSSPRSGSSFLDGICTHPRRFSTTRSCRIAPVTGQSPVRVGSRRQ